ncbi:MAG TPA: ribosome assembly RNA-binding protein YhbY [Candidatus Hydrogenedentes bacterium]|nr:ribosome assembly RNA-binding protein YhbY [Candidatus Hydrogenedentota bacterium]HNT88795.1 ribosome assembly RNA-binding protein YhbY [Candidatus Hydrogenedentota bacterium]
MHALTSSQRKYLRAAAHHLAPLIIVGKHGLTDALVRAAGEALEDHELIKVRFNDFKDRKRELSEEIARRTGAHIVGALGHVFILYRQHPEADKRTVALPDA